MAINQQLHNYLLTLGMFTSLEDDVVSMSLDRTAARNFMDNWKTYRDVMKPFVNDRTLEHITELIEHSRHSFCGGDKSDLINDLQGEINMAPYIKQYENLENNDLMSKLKTAGALSKPRRKRKMSEHDGDWEYDRMWELKPYQNCLRKQQVLKTVKIDAHFACSGGTDASTITKYGGLVWAIAKIIEDAGIQTEITYCERAVNVGYNGTGVDTRVLLKKPGEYIAPTFLAACFTSNHYRRLGFALQAMCVPVNENDRSCDSMGQAKPKKAMEFSEGRLTLDVKSNNLSFAEVEKTIMEIIGKGKDD